MSRSGSAAILALLEVVAGLDVHDSDVQDADDNEKTISAPTPYAVFYTAPDYPEGRSLAGPAGVGIQDFQVNFVGETREQAEWACEKSRAALDDKRLPDGGVIRRGTANLTIRRDDVWTRPDGGPLFYGVDRYSVAHA